MTIRNINEMFIAAMEMGDADRPFIFYELSKFSYRHTYEQWTSIARALVSLNIGHSDRVVTVLPNTPRLIDVIFGITAIGAIYAPLMEAASIEEMEYFLGDIQAKAVILTGEQLARLSSVIGSAEIEHVLVVDNPSHLPETPPTPARLLNDVIAAAPYAELDLSLVGPEADLSIMYTSGTTGRPKGIVLQHAGFCAHGALQAEWMGFEPGDTVLGIMPLFHMAGFHMCVAPALSVGGGYMMQEKFSVSRFWRDVDFSHCKGGIAVPLALNALLAQPPNADDRNHSLKRVVSQFIPENMRDRFGVDVRPLWTMTELAGSGTWTRADSEPVPHLVGRQISRDVEIAIWDEERRPVETCIRGEIVCRSPWTFKEYWRKPEQTAETKIDGWVRTGDFGYLDDQGQLYYIDRLKNMIKRSGENVAALEVEGVVRRLSGVEDVACFGVPDPIRMEEVKIVVTLKAPDILTTEQIVAWCKERLSDFKVPRYIEIRQQLPRTRTHKPDLGLLRREHQSSPGWDRSAPSWR